MKIKTREYATWYLMLAIPLIGTVIFNVYPLIKTIIDSFQNSKNVFINLINYKILFSDQMFIKSIGNTLYMALLGVTIVIILAFTLANILNLITKGKGFFKVVYLLPMIMSMVTVANLFKYLMMPDESGMLNYIGGLFGMAPKLFFNDPSTSRESIIALAMWKGVGYNVILFFAGLQNVPVELYEAAEIDGANEWKKWYKITIPSMRGTFVFVLITATIGALKRFAEVYAISGETGNPANSLSTIMVYIYKNSFSTLNYKDLGLASAASVFLFVIIMFFTLINFFLTRDKDEVRNKKIEKAARKAKKIGGR